MKLITITTGILLTIFALVIIFPFVVMPANAEIVFDNTYTFSGIRSIAFSNLPDYHNISAPSSTLYVIDALNVNVDKYKIINRYRVLSVWQSGNTWCLGSTGGVITSYVAKEASGELNDYTGFTAYIGDHLYGTGTIGWVREEPVYGRTKVYFDINFNYVDETFANTLSGHKAIVFNYDHSVFTSKSWTTQGSCVDDGSAGTGYSLNPDDIGLNMNVSHTGYGAGSTERVMMIGEAYVNFDYTATAHIIFNNFSTQYGDLETEFNLQDFNISYYAGNNDTMSYFRRDYIGRSVIVPYTQAAWFNLELVSTHESVTRSIFNTQPNGGKVSITEFALSTPDNNSFNMAFTVSNTATLGISIDGFETHIGSYTGHNSLSFETSPGVHTACTYTLDYATIECGYVTVHGTLPGFNMLGFIAAGTSDPGWYTFSFLTNGYSGQLEVLEDGHADVMVTMLNNTTIYTGWHESMPGDHQICGRNAANISNSVCRNVNIGSNLSTTLDITYSSGYYNTIGFVHWQITAVGTGEYRIYVDNEIVWGSLTYPARNNGSLYGLSIGNHTVGIQPTDNPTDRKSFVVYVSSISNATAPGQTQPPSNQNGGNNIMPSVPSGAGLAGMFSNIDPFAGFFFSLFLTGSVFAGSWTKGGFGLGCVAGGIMLMTCLFLGVFPWVWFVMIVALIAVLGYIIYSFNNRGD